MVPNALVQFVSAHAPCVVVLVGAPGAGKSTLAAACAKRLGAGVEVLSYAEHRAEVSGDPADQTVDSTAGALLFSRLAARCATGATTIVDGTHHLARTRASLLAIASDAGMAAVAVVLSTPLEVCLARQQDRPAAQAGKQWGLRIPESQVRQLDAAIQAAQAGLMKEGFVVHVLDPRDTVSSDRL